MSVRNSVVDPYTFQIFIESVDGFKEFFPYVECIVCKRKYTGSLYRNWIIVSELIFET